ncbi:MAG: translation initiation factor [Bacteroidia bacterium]|nr:translation initiation factor [Bacteroidia bacterium]
MSKKNKKNRAGVVYSTNPDHQYQYQSDEEMDTLPPQQQQLRVEIDRKNRKGKAVTVVYGFEGSTDDLKDLGKMLKTKCGVGGTVKDDEILIQGNFKTKIYDLLKSMGYSQTKMVGG